MHNVEVSNRSLVFVHWAFQDLSFSCGARLITGSDFYFNKEIAAQRSETATGPNSAVSV